MARDDKDRSSKWILQHHGGSILPLAGLPAVSRWESGSTDVVLPRQMPDGYLRVQFEGAAGLSPVIIEIATYPERRTTDQMLRDLMIVYLNENVVPDIITLVLRPKGNLTVSGQATMSSAGASARINFRCCVINLWELRAETLLATNDIGLIPWVPLTDFDEEPEEILQVCRERIDQSPEEQRINFLAVCQVMTRLRYNNRDLMNIFGGRQVMIESPLIQELIDEAEERTRRETRCQDILTVLRGRFDDLPSDLQTAIEKIKDLAILEQLIQESGRCPDLESFRSALPKDE